MGKMLFLDNFNCSQHIIQPGTYLAHTGLYYVLYSVCFDTFQFCFVFFREYYWSNTFIWTLKKCITFLTLWLNWELDTLIRHFVLWINNWWWKIIWKDWLFVLSSRALAHFKRCWFLDWTVFMNNLLFLLVLEQYLKLRMPLSLTWTFGRF